MGAIDIHFHGAFGIDLMSAKPTELKDLSYHLGRTGVAAFCATTLSVPFPELREAVRRLGSWIAAPQENKRAGAIPLGIHLEGPYIHPGACGAHPTAAIRPLHFDELDTLWEDSQHQLKILTTAPELLSLSQLMRLGAWAAKRRIILSLGHSKATEAQATQAFEKGFSGVTHAWNAMPFHHRDPGPLGAALGRSGIGIELILDQIHVAPILLRWTRSLHLSKGPLCYVSDCVPAAGTEGGRWHTFGNLKVRFKDGASRLAGGHLAGGGILLPKAFARWVEAEARRTGQPLLLVLKSHLPHLTFEPLRYLGMEKKAPWLLKYRAVEWISGPRGKLTAQPVF